jgi:type IV secretion system protein VirB9
LKVASFLIALCVATACGAQVRPIAGPGDPRIQTIAYDPNQVVQLQVASGFQLTVEFSSGERIENVAVGDGAAWQVTPNKRGDRLFVKAIAVGVTTNLTVLTDARTYNFELMPAYGPLPDMPFDVRFTYPEPAIATIAGAEKPAEGLYKLTGAKALRPTAISDDGAKTYIEFAVDRPLPAVFAINEAGQETLVDGVMRAGQYVIDAVRPKLLFRIDRQTARATRIRARK